MSSLTTNLFIITAILVLLPTQCYAFGAGDIPDFAYLNDKAFRHGDIENILATLAKTTGKVAGGGGLLGFASSVLSSGSGGSKFDKGDIKKVYFGNWLRDYSQAMDIGGLSKLSADTLVLIVSVLGFMTFGFATEEYQVTPERLGVYLPVEHIDNPKGYAEKEGDARQFHPKLRPPVDRRELEIDQRTGMKNYIATEGQSWDTSTAHIRRVFRACIDHGRRARGNDGGDLWEAYRLLGTGLHTLEDLLAHSNWCEITLRKMGHQDVFCHVGDSVLINTPNGQAPPLVTGTFGGADFLHSLMGEATDHISQASVTDLSEKMDQASNDGGNQLETLQSLFKQLPIGGSDDKMNQGQDLQEKSKAYNFDPDNVAPPEVQAQLFELLVWHDNIFRDILEKIESVPGLADVVENITNALNAYVYSILAPWLSPILKQATGVLGEGSKAVIDSDDQYEVFNNPEASDPSHSLLSKDHFGLILNEPAGKIAQTVVENSVKLIVGAWFSDNEDPDQVIDQILEAFHHPYYATGRSRIQQEMYEGMEKWLGALGSTESREILQALTKESVREGKNKRKSQEDDGAPITGGGGYGTGQSQSQSGHGGSSQGYGSSGRSGGGGYNNQQNQYEGSGGGNGGGGEERSSHSSRKNREDEGGYSQGNTYGSSEDYGSERNRNQGGGGYGSQREERSSSGYNQESRGESESYGASRRQDNDGGYGRSDSSYSRNEESRGYGGGGEEERGSSGYGRQSESHGRGGEETYGSSERQTSYSSRNEERSERSSGYGQQSEYSSNAGYGREEQSYEQPRQERSNREESSGYGGGGHSEYTRGEEQSSGYSGRTEERGYGGGGENRGYGGGSESGGYGGGGESRGYSEQEESGRGGNQYEQSEETFGAERLNLGNDEYGGGEESERRRDYNEYE